MRTIPYIIKGIKSFALTATIMSGLLLPLDAAAETVSQKEASRLANIFFNQANGRVTPAPKMVYNGRRLTTDHLFVPFYVYNSPATGFVIISAENKAFPILGYSLKETFDPERLNDTEKALLKEYARDIEYIRYDSRMPDKAITAWTDIPGYIASLLDAKYDATDPVFDAEETREVIENLEESDDADRYSSDIYTPEQWQDLIDGELLARRGAMLGIVSGNRLMPAVVHGRKGDYYRIELGRRNSWLMRLMATEFLSDGQLAMLGDAPELPEPKEEPPFQLYDSFLAETRDAEMARQAAIEETLIPTEPVLRAMGAGHFDVEFSENIQLARIYNLEGSMVGCLTFGDTSRAHIDISAQPSGFYFLLVNGDSGRPYGLKLFR